MVNFTHKQKKTENNRFMWYLIPTLHSFSGRQTQEELGRLLYFRINLYKSILSDLKKLDKLIYPHVYNLVEIWRKIRGIYNRRKINGFV